MFVVEFVVESLDLRSSSPGGTLRFQKTCPAGLVFSGAGHVVALPGSRAQRGVKGPFCGFCSNLEGTPLDSSGGLGASHMAGAEKDQANGALLDRFFGTAAPYRSFLFWFLKTSRGLRFAQPYPPYPLLKPAWG